MARGGNPPLHLLPAPPPLPAPPWTLNTAPPAPGRFVNRGRGNRWRFEAADRPLNLLGKGSSGRDRRLDGGARERNGCAKNGAVRGWGGQEEKLERAAKNFQWVAQLRQAAREGKVEDCRRCVSLFGGGTGTGGEMLVNMQDEQGGAFPPLL